MFKYTQLQFDKEFEKIINDNPQWEYMDTLQVREFVKNAYDRISNIANTRGIYTDYAGHQSILGDIITGIDFGENEATIVRRWSENKHETFFEYGLYEGAFEEIEKKLSDYGYTTSVLRGLRYNKDDVISFDDGRGEVRIEWSTDNGSPVIEYFEIVVDGRTIYKHEGKKLVVDDEDYRPRSVEATPIDVEEIARRVKQGNRKGLTPTPTKKGEENSYLINANTVYVRHEDHFEEMNVELRVSKNGHLYYYNTTLNRLAGYKKR